MVATGLLISLASVVLSSKASPARRDLVIHERSVVPSGFTENGPAPVSTILTLRMALVSNNLAGLEETLYTVSTPGSDLYGQYLTKEEVEAFVAPAKETTAAVHGFLAANNIEATTISPAGDWLSFSIPVSQANELLNADFAEFTHEATGETAIRTLAYSIPASLKGKVDFIHPTVAFPVFVGQPPIVSTFRTTSTVTPDVSPSTNAVPASCNTEITPACLQALYGVPASASASGSQIGVSGFIQQFAQKADLQSFLTSFRPDIPSTTVFATQLIDGGTNPQAAPLAGIEANLDTQYTVGVAGGIPVTFISVGPLNNDGINGFLDLVNTLLQETNPPQVLSTSYGFNEPSVSASIANSLCNAYMQLSARGTSIIFSSGDGGVSGGQSQSCTTFVPTFPSTCPFVTSIGATTGVTETAASFSSGGFSNIFARPSFQDAAVTAYLAALGNTDAGLFNTTGRAFPDLSAQGENFIIFDGGQSGLVSGTSCSAPTFSSIVSLLNAELLAAGKPVVGFMNPFVYANPGVFNDITTGDNPGCNTNGFPATTGWDPVTGVGTPNFAKLKTAFGL